MLAVMAINGSRRVGVEPCDRLIPPGSAADFGACAPNWKIKPGLCAQRVIVGRSCCS
jgi:hypothetical protein